MLFALVVCTSLEAQTTIPLYRMEAKYQQMGTSWKIVVYVQDTLVAAAWISEAWKKLDTLNQQMSDYDSSSELLRLTLDHPHRQWIPVSAPLYEVLARAQYFSKASKGVFDATVGPLSVLWRRAFRRQTFPEKNKIRSARKKVNYRWLKLKDQAVYFKKAQMRLDLGGIAKGYAVDYLFDFLQQKAIQALLIEGGGDLRVGAPPPQQEAWNIQLLNQQVIPLVHQAIATSGATYKYLEYQGLRYSHIIHPKTGYGQNGRQTITIVTNHCQDADALASIGNLVQPSQLKRLKRNLPFDFQIINIQ